LTIGPLGNLMTFQVGQEGMPDMERYLPVAASDYEGAAEIACEEGDGALDQAKGMALVKAMPENNRAEVERLLCDPKTDVNASSAAYYTNTPLHWATQLDWPQGSGYFWQHHATRQLIERGASMHKKRTLDNKSTLELARDENHLYSLRFLIDCAQMLGRYLVRAIHESKGDPSEKWLIDWLLDNPNTDVNSFSTEREYYGDTPLVAVLKRDWPVSSISWQQEVVERLLQRGANPDMQVVNWAGASQDWWQIQKQQERANLQLPASKPAIEYGSEQARMVAKGMAAKYKGRVAPTVWDIVLDGKQMPETALPVVALTPERLGWQLIDAIVADNVARVKELLEDPKTDVNAQKSDDVGNTPLTAMAAVQWPSKSDEHRALADKMIERGAKFDKWRKYSYQTPLQVALGEGNDATKQYFKEQAVKVAGNDPQALGLRLVDALVIGSDDVLFIESLIDMPETDLNAQHADPMGNTALTAIAATDAINRGDAYSNFTMKLIACGADLQKAARYQGRTPRAIADDTQFPKSEKTREFFRKASEGQLPLPVCTRGTTLAPAQEAVPAPAPVPVPASVATPTPAPAVTSTEAAAAVAIPVAKATRKARWRWQRNCHVGC